jgi:cell division protein ZipA
MDPTQLRIVLLVLGLLFIAGVYWFGRPRKPGQGRRLGERAGSGEPVRDEVAFSTNAHDSLDKVIQAELARLERTLASDDPAPAAASAGARAAPGIEFEPDLDARLAASPDQGEFRAGAPAGAASAAQQSTLGARPNPEFDKVVSLIVAARAGTLLHGSDILVAAEKVGLLFGDMQIFHRLPENRPESGPIFSVANVVKPGNFDLRHPDHTQTPGVTFFMTLPGPLPALDAWEAMLPAAQRFAELLDAVVLDDERNALGRQRIQFLRDEMRAYDRERERQSKRTW